ncbi:MAG TPA: arginase family protein [Spirochaetia bacterium]|nr:arginase family protein [Spirochaetia bacterium]
MRVCFISVPFDLGRYNSGHGLGPRKLMSSGLDRLLSEAGHTVDSKTVVCNDADSLTDIQTTFALNGLLSETVASVAESGTFPIVLAGNCITTAGAISGLHRESLGMLWLDAHADFNTPDSSTSGYLDGMALSVACGNCWKSLAARDPRYRPVAENNVALVGARDVDRGEAELLAGSRVRRVSRDQLRKEGFRLPREAAPEAEELFIHLDADVLDLDIGRANSFAVAGGLSENDVVSLLGWAVSSYRVVGAAVTAYSPVHDETGAIRQSLVRIVLSLVNAVGIREGRPGR